MQVCSQTRVGSCRHASSTARVSRYLPRPRPTNSGSSPKYAISVEPSGCRRSSKISRRRPGHRQQPDGARAREVRPELCLAPDQSVAPVILSAHLHVEVAVEVPRAVPHFLEPDIRTGAPLRLEVGGRGHLEVGTQDFDGGHRGKYRSCRLSAVGCRVSGIGYRLSAIGYRLSAIGYQLSAIRRQASGVACRDSVRGTRHAVRGTRYAVPRSTQYAVRSPPPTPQPPVVQVPPRGASPGRLQTPMRYHASHAVERPRAHALTAAPAAAQGWIEIERPRIPLPVSPNIVRVSSEVRTAIDGRVARVEVEERFRNSGGGIAEGSYLYPAARERRCSRTSRSGWESRS